MARIELDKNGVVVPWTPIRPAVNTKPSNDLFILDRIAAGQPVRIAIHRLGGGIGDVLMTFPTVKALKKKYNAETIYVTDYGYLSGALAKVANHNPLIDKVVDGAHWKDINAEININLTCPCIAHEIPLAKPVHRIDLFAGYCGIRLDDRQIDYVVTEEEKAWGINFLQTRNLNPADCVLVQPYASNARRSLDIKKLQRAMMQALAVNPKLRFLVVRHDSDFDKDTSWDLQKTFPVRNFDIVNIAAIMYHVGLVLCPDSSLLHMAGALSKKIVAFFGPTDYRARMYPNMIPICPAETFAFWPPWYQENPPGASKLCWDVIESETISAAIIEQMTISVPVKINNNSFLLSETI